MEELLLKDVKHEYHSKDRVCDWDYIEAPECGNRIYYKPLDGDGVGFSFSILEHNGYPLIEETKNNKWHVDYVWVHILFEGHSYFDGIRHLYMGSEQNESFGYDYYTDLEGMIESLKILRELELKYCNDCLKSNP